MNGNTTYRIAVIGVVAVAAGVVLGVKTLKSRPEPVPENGGALRESLPVLVDLGANKCKACKMMAPILEELKREFSETFDVRFIDVWENPQAGERYGIRMIPTQIFYDGEGKELFRHEGFFGREEILAKWEEFGLNVPVGTEDAPSDGNTVQHTQSGR